MAQKPRLSSACHPRTITGSATAPSPRDSCVPNAVAGQALAHPGGNRHRCHRGFVSLRGVAPRGPSTSTVFPESRSGLSGSRPVEVRRALPPPVEVRRALPAVPRALPVTSALSTVPMHSGSRSGCLTARSCRLLTRVNCPPAQLCPPEGVLLARSTQPAMPHGSG